MGSREGWENVDQALRAISLVRGQPRHLPYSVLNVYEVYIYIQLALRGMSLFS